VQVSVSDRPVTVDRAAAGAGHGRLLILSKQLPIVLARDGGSLWRAVPTHGALVAALSTILRDRGGVWIGWPGVTDEELPAVRKILAGAIHEGGYTLRPVALTEQEKSGAFVGFSGEVIRPLFHDLPAECNFDRAYWQAYRRVNRKFAAAAVRALGRASGQDLVWVQDHRLMSVAARLRQLKVPARAARLAFFLHLPFPAPDTFCRLPWRDRLISALLAYDLIGFQTERDRSNFLACVRMLVPLVSDIAMSCDGTDLWRVRGRSFSTGVGAFPMGVDFRELAARAARPEVAAQAEALRALHRGRKLVLAIDPLDHAAGIPGKLRAFAELLDRHPELAEKVSFLQVVVPSRETVPQHAALRTEIDRAVGEINGRFSRPGWIPVHYTHRELTADDLLACYRAADVAFAAPLKAGMDLVCKEYCAADVEERGALVLSEFAGAADQLAGGALLVNPYNTEATASTLHKALRLRRAERAAHGLAARRSRPLRRVLVGGPLPRRGAAGAAGRRDAPAGDVLIPLLETA